MLRSGAGHPDADEAATPVASTSTTTTRSPEEQAQDLHNKLNEYLLLENKFQPRLGLLAEGKPGEVTTGARDGAAHVLRYLKAWYDLPAEVLINAINFFDRFLTKMKVRPSHVPCITMSCMNIALERYAQDTNIKRTLFVKELLDVSQTECTTGDVRRMSKVIVDKLSLAAGCNVTSLDWLRLFRNILLLYAQEVGISADVLGTEQELVQVLEIVSCDAACVNIRTSELALVMIYHRLEELLREPSSLHGVERDHALFLYQFAKQLQIDYCQICDTSVELSYARVLHVISRYERSDSRRDQGQRLVWKLSERTLKVLRPTDGLTSMLPTIEEQHYQVDVTPTRNRSGSESSENEETSDWPRSPVLPVYCDN